MPSYRQLRSGKLYRTDILLDYYPTQVAWTDSDSPTDLRHELKKLDDVWYTHLRRLLR